MHDRIELHRKLFRRLSTVFVLAIALAGMLSFSGQAVTGPELTWSSMDSGGVSFAVSGSTTLGSTTGQADAVMMTSGSTVLVGGFWGGASAFSSTPTYSIFLPCLMR